MKFLKQFIIAIWACIAINTLVVAKDNPAENPRKKYNFNPGWRVFAGDPAGAEATTFHDETWKSVTLPYAWNEDEAFKKDIAALSTGIAWYRKHFKVPANHSGQRVFVEFEGVRQAGEVYLNGQFIGLHENGAMAFGFDVTNLIKFGQQENVLAVRTNNAWDYREKATNTKYQWSDKNFNANYGGISKNVYLHVTRNLYQTLPLYAGLGTVGSYIYAKDFNIAARSATITAESEVRNAYPEAKSFEYEVTIEDMNGKLIKTIKGNQEQLQPDETKKISTSAKVEGLNFWSWGYGYLYTVYTTLKVNGKIEDVVKTRTGFRKTEFKEGMVFLNDRVIQLKGYAQRTSNEWPAVGLSVPAWLSDYSNRLMVESNANLVRWMHITPWKQDIESCDRVGLIQAMPAGDSEKDVNDRRWGQRVELMRDAIIYNRNNPSIFFYESGNESISEAHMGEMKAIRDQYDSHGGRAIGSREMLNSKVSEYGGEMLYVNKSAGQPMWATEYSRDEGLRKYWDEYTPPYHKEGEGPLHNGQNASSYNHNQDAHAIENVIRWFDFWRERAGTGKRVSSGGVNIIFSDSNTHHRGAENYRRSGEVDAMRIPKDGYFAHQVMWDGWVDPEKERTHLIGHWNYEPSTKKNVYVVSTGEKVELFVNGVSMGFGEPSYRFLYTFKNIQWKPGTITAVGYDANGKKTSEAKLQTAGKPAALKLTVHQHPAGLQANGTDLALVQVEVVDAKGNRCPTALNTVNFSLDGPAEWRGGIAQGPDNYILAKSLPVECGVNRVLVRASTQAGKIVVKANSEGLKSASLALTSKKVVIEEGLSLTLPGDHLPSFLGRGPSPTTPSYRVSRVAVPIASASAGANSDSARYSFDDNELSVWQNNGQATTGWIQYELERSAAISEVALKLADWRSRMYPLRITVDGKEVFNASTERNLGYFTIKFPPQTGKTLKIELTGAGLSQDAYNIVEVTGKKDPAGEVKNDGTKNGKLAIVEVEIYEKQQ